MPIISAFTYVTLDATAFANTFVTMTKGKWLFAEPFDVENRSLGWFEECAKETLLERWRGTVRERALLIREHEKVLDVVGEKDDFAIVSDSGEYRARRVVLCLGKAGNPRKLGVTGEKENAAKIHHRLLDPDDFHDQDVLIVGAGDVACEAAIALAADGTNRVTLSAIDEEFTFPKKTQHRRRPRARGRGQAVDPALLVGEAGSPTTKWRSRSLASSASSRTTSSSR